MNTNRTAPSQSGSHELAVAFGAQNEQLIGTPAVEFVQTYATATLENLAPTATILTPLGAGVDHTLVDVTTTAVADPDKVNANFNDMAAVVNALIVDLANAKQLINSLVDELQRRSLVG